MHLLVLSESSSVGKTVLPALDFLDHSLAHLPLDVERLAQAPAVDLVLVDATGDLARAAQCVRTAAISDRGCPVVVIVGDGALAALKASWGFDDWVLPGSQPAELETRLRIAAERATADRRGSAASVGELHIDDETYVVRLRGEPLDLTYREFALLRHLAANPGRVFTRDQLLSEVWGYDYYGGTRTVDVHIRRLRAKLGAEHDSLIGTIRGVGYKLDPQGPTAAAQDADREVEAGGSSSA